MEELSREEESQLEERLRNAATKGAELLDEIDRDWFTRIDLETLNLEDSCFCVLGQLEGTFLDGLFWLDRATEMTWKKHREDPGWVEISPPTPDIASSEYGFVTRYDDEDVQTAFEILTEAWRVLIEDRRSR